MSTDENCLLAMLAFPIHKIHTSCVAPAMTAVTGCGVAPGASRRHQSALLKGRLQPTLSSPAPSSPPRRSPAGVHKTEKVNIIIQRSDSQGKMTR
eukprot:scaffold389804_cov13-Prasinocladus_malaysianus.AAC.1